MHARAEAGDGVRGLGRSGREMDVRTGLPRGKRMKALCNREGLLAAFGMVSGVVPARSPKPILQNVKLVADPDEGSILMATDLEVGIRHRVLGMKVEQPGAVILPTARMRVDPADQHRRGAGPRGRRRPA